MSQTLNMCWIYVFLSLWHLICCVDMIPAPLFPYVHFTHLQKLLILFLKIHYYVALFFLKNIKCNMSNIWNFNFAVLTSFVLDYKADFGQKKRLLYEMISVFFISVFFFENSFLHGLSAKKNVWYHF